MRALRLLVIVLVCFSFFAFAEKVEEIRRWVEQLDAPKYRDREKAHAKLASAGVRARSVLMESIAHPVSEEQNSRLRKLLYPFTDHPADFRAIGTHLMEELQKAPSSTRLRETADKVLNQVSYADYLELETLFAVKQSAREQESREKAQFEALNIYRIAIGKAGGKAHLVRRSVTDGEERVVIFELGSYCFFLGFGHFKSFRTFKVAEISCQEMKPGRDLSRRLNLKLKDHQLPNLKDSLSRLYPAGSLPYLLFSENRRGDQPIDGMHYNQVLNATAGDPKYTVTLDSGGYVGGPLLAIDQYLTETTGLFTRDWYKLYSVKPRIPEDLEASNRTLRYAKWAPAPAKN